MASSDCKGLHLAAPNDFPLSFADSLTLFAILWQFCAFSFLQRRSITIKNDHNNRITT